MKQMNITMLSDLHGFMPILQGGDLLVIAGDLTANDKKPEYLQFTEWYHAQKYAKKVLICGNHDKLVHEGKWVFDPVADGYLCDSETEFMGVKIYGSPWTPKFKGINPKYNAFMLADRSLKKKFDAIPKDTGILITHGPPYGILDLIRKGDYLESVGSLSLSKSVHKIKPRLHIFGHIHEYGGKFDYHYEKKHLITEYRNVSIVNERYAYNRKITNLTVELSDFAPYPGG